MIYGPSYGTRIFGGSFLCDLSPLILGLEALFESLEFLGVRGEVDIPKLPNL